MIQLCIPPGLILKRDYRDIGLVLFLAGELYGSIYKSIESVVLAHTDVPVRIVDCTALTDDDIAGLNDLAAEFLETQALAL